MEAVIQRDVTVELKFDLRGLGCNARRRGDRRRGVRGGQTLIGSDDVAAK